ncbi:MAG: MFS transporter, partial [Candidatus Hodarchaeota archaeon]
MGTEEMQTEESTKMRWLHVFAIGLGFFTTGVSWNVYNSYLPADFLPAFIGGDLQNTIIGAIMVLDNILALFMQPYIGAKSDSTRTRWGRRMPYIMIGTPLAAAFFTLIAYGWAIFGFWFMFAVITVFNVSMAFYRAPVVALMPDVVPSEHRSKANGVINLMGGIGAIYAFAIASQIYKIGSPDWVADNPGNPLA